MKHFIRPCHHLDRSGFEEAMFTEPADTEHRWQKMQMNSLKNVQLLKF